MGNLQPQTMHGNIYYTRWLGYIDIVYMFLWIRWKSVKQFSFQSCLQTTICYKTLIWAAGRSQNGYFHLVLKFDFVTIIILSLYYSARKYNPLSCVSMFCWISYSNYTSNIFYKTKHHSWSSRGQVDKAAGFGFKVATFSLF